MLSPAGDFISKPCQRSLARTNRKLQAILPRVNSTRPGNEACHGSLYCLTTRSQFIATVAFCRKHANFCVWFA
jgi:hypothetical protein